MGIGTALLTGMLNASSTSATIPTAILAGHSSQTANLLTLANSSGSFLSGFTASGGLLMNIASTTAMEIQNGSGTSVFRVSTSGALGATMNAATTTDSLRVGGLLTTGGNVGIGTTSPNFKLETMGTASSSLLFVGGTGLTATTTQIYGGFIADVDSSTLVVNANENTVGIGGNPGSAKLYVNGNMGIGTTGPGAPLDVQKSGTGFTEVILARHPSWLNGRVAIGHRSGEGELQIFNSSNVSEIKISAGDHSYFNHAGGNVGIGTTGPDGKLDVRDGNAVLSDADVAHGMTDLDATTAYGRLSALSGTEGGLQILGYSDSGADTGLHLYSVIGNADPTDTVPAIVLRANKKSGTTDQAQIGR